MGTLETYLKNFQDTFDVTTIIDPDVAKIESAIYHDPLIYKYFSKERRQFFTKPQVRFSQKEALNDPFESSVRWKKVSLNGLNAYVSHRANDVIPKLFSNPEYLIERAKEELNENGVVLTPQRNTRIEEWLRSDAGKAYVTQLLPGIKDFMQMATGKIFSHLATNFEALIDDVVGKMGVLSLTERPLNEVMWRRYAGDGTGFVIGFDAQHPFFIKDRDGVPMNVLRKVIYTEQWTENFWRNPYYLFLVKGLGWAPEQEWRMFKDFTECDESRGSDTAAIHLATLTPEIIKSVYFGYSNDVATIEKGISTLAHYGCAPTCYRVNRRNGALEATVIN